MSAPATATRATVKLAAPGILPASSNAFVLAFRSELRAEAEALRAAFASQIPDDSPLREVSVLEAEARVAFADRRRRSAANLEPVLTAALQGALEDAGWLARSVELRVRLRGGAARPGTTIELEAPR